MTTHPRWLIDLFRDKGPGAPPDARRDPTGGLLELARRLARTGHLYDAEREYAHLSRTHGSPQIWLEHAEVQLAIGERLQAAFNATRALEADPHNARALHVREAALARGRPQPGG